MFDFICMNNKRSFIIIITLSTEVSERSNCHTNHTAYYAHFFAASVDQGQTNLSGEHQQHHNDPVSEEVCRTAGQSGHPVDYDGVDRGKADDRWHLGRQGRQVVCTQAVDTTRLSGQTRHARR